MSKDEFIMCLVLRIFVPNLSDFQWPTSSPSGRKARPFEALLYLLGRGRVYPWCCWLKNFKIVGAAFSLDPLKCRGYTVSESAHYNLKGFRR